MGHDHHDHHDHADQTVLAEVLDLDAEVLHTYLTDLTAWLRDLVGDPAPRRIVDLGAGTGTGTFALLERFPDAEVVALDASAQLLHRLGSRARDLGVADRVRTVEADLDVAWPAVGTADLVWASASLHHVADPARVLTDVLGTLRPGGHLAVVELDSFPRFLPEDLGFGRPGLEARFRALVAAQRATDMPHLGADWGPRLSAAGFTVEVERVIEIELTPPLPEAAARYAQASLTRLRSGFGDRLDAEDRAALDVLLGGNLLQRDDLTVRATRTVWLATRP
ncbi:class I SAM-dependent methyltransferase [Umezawaea beigongshangensis]|uniref:class I SAM-dependent methyltransferase n=1 Tax=Umezawaea beigongshangensis TaxID=2780383 RepID=UPI0018F24772|nr:class I SAM-dependent methyltransferase [Umezawaea beigongshangensis]